MWFRRLLLWAWMLGGRVGVYGAALDTNQTSSQNPTSIGKASRHFGFGQRDMVTPAQREGSHHLPLLGLYNVPITWIWNTSVHLSSISYCGEPKRSQALQSVGGFIPIGSGFDDSSSDTQGLVGVLPSQEAIYIVFRGSESIMDWYYDLSVLLVQYPRPADGSAHVHAGFYAALNSVLPRLMRTLRPLLIRYPRYRIVCTGHSLGGALATLMALELVAPDSTLPLDDRMVHLVNFGSPRVGDAAFAAYASDVLTSKFRFTHFKDIVPHTPYLGFLHLEGERYENANGVLYTCIGSEDPTCSSQWSLPFCNFDSHLVYLGKSIGCPS
jgi:Lipase (class 3)